MSKQKNTRNKAKHSKLLAKKKNKEREKKIAREIKMKELVQKMNLQKETNKK